MSEKIPFAVIDIEASNAFPLEGEICEIAILAAGQAPTDPWQSLIKPSKPMSDFIIGIHGITNEMVADAPKIEDQVEEIHSRLKDRVMVAHHAPFDAGFLAWEFEKAGLPLPNAPILCTSLLSINLYPEVGNHKLQTLVKHFDFPPQTAHRALGDTVNCHKVLEKCIERVKNPTLEGLIEAQKKSLKWSDFSIQGLRKEPLLNELVDCVLAKKPIQILYGGGQGQGKERTIDPIGIVRNPDGDFLMGFCHKDQKNKRFYLRKLKEIHA